MSVTLYSSIALELQVPESNAPLPLRTKGGNQAPRCILGTIVNWWKDGKLILEGLHFSEE